MRASGTPNQDQKTSNTKTRRDQVGPLNGANGNNLAGTVATRTGRHGPAMSGNVLGKPDPNPSKPDVPSEMSWIACAESTSQVKPAA